MKKSNNNYESNNKYSTNVFSPQNIFSPPNQGKIYINQVPSQNESRNNDMNNNLNKTREEKLNRGFVFPHDHPLKESFQS